MWRTEHMDCEQPQNCPNCKQNHTEIGKKKNIRNKTHKEYLITGSKKNRRKFSSNNICKCCLTHEHPNPKSRNDPLCDDSPD